MHAGRLLVVGLLAASVTRTAPPAPSIAFNLRVGPRVVRGEAPQPVGQRIYRDSPLWHTGQSASPGAGSVYGYLVRGDAPPLPTGYSARWTGHPDPIFAAGPGSLFSAAQVPLPGARVTRSRTPHTGSSVAFFLRIGGRHVRGDEPPVPQGSVVRTLVPHTGAVFIGERHAAKQGRRVYGEAPPLPGHAVSRTPVRHVGEATQLHDVRRPRYVTGEAPPTPQSSVVRGRVWAVGSPQQLPHVRTVRVVAGEAPPVPVPFVRIGVVPYEAEGEVDLILVPPSLGLRAPDIVAALRRALGNRGPMEH